ncbi:MAG: transposase [Thaumarchaeota archaeon]|jgi:hypothetical protein|nr:transposase [Candidatus Wolframiiraptor allenii]
MSGEGLPLFVEEAQSTLNRYGLKNSKRLSQMYVKWRRQVRHYIDAKVRQAMEWLYGVGGFHNQGRLPEEHRAGERQL